MATITIHLIDEHGGAVAVLTSSAAPIPGARLTPAQALALDLIAAARHSAARRVLGIDAVETAQDFDA